MRPLFATVVGLFVATITLSSTVDGAKAAPMEWTTGSGGNGHFYELILDPLDPLTWTDARNAASSMTHNGQSGYLATVTSAAEQTFLDDFIHTTNTAAWLGGSDQATEGEWIWVDGPEAGQQFWDGNQSGSVGPDISYANWRSGEPNNTSSTGSSEDALVGWFSGDSWNDVPTTSAFDAYIVEFNAAGPSTIPTPGALILLSTGIIGLGLTALRRRGWTQAR